MSRPAPPVSRRFATLTPGWAGFLLSLLAAVVYTFANVCLRGVAHLDGFWVSSLKAVPMVLVSAVMVGYGWYLGGRWKPTVGTVLALLATGIMAQIGGNVGLQVAFARVGLAVAVALNFSTIIVGGAIVGRICLEEHVSARSSAAMGLVLAAIVVLTFAAPSAQGAVSAAAVGVWPIFVGVTAACLSGLAYAILGVVIRHMVRGAAPLPVILFIVSATGVVGLGTVSLLRVGWQGMLDTPTIELERMAWAGIFNAVAFVALSKALELAPIVEVNAVNASQTAMAALAGVLVYDEPVSFPLVAGIFLTGIGLLLIDRPKISREPTCARSGEPELKMCDTR